MKQSFFTLIALIISVSIYSQSGNFTDNRDGKVYQTIKIGNQTWMAQNLNFVTANSLCYDNNSANCDKYGRLYYWKEAKSICPVGWHLPSNDEYNTLLKSAGGGEGVEAYNSLIQGGNSGFSALLAGWNNGDGFNVIDKITSFWSSTPIGKEGAMALEMNGYHTKALMYGCGSKEWYSVRCVKNN